MDCWGEVVDYCTAGLNVEAVASTGYSNKPWPASGQDSDPVSEVVVDAASCLVGAPGHSLWVAGACYSPLEAAAVVVVVVVVVAAAVKRTVAFCEKAAVRVCAVEVATDSPVPCGLF